MHNRYQRLDGSDGRPLVVYSSNSSFIPGMVVVALAIDVSSATLAGGVPSVREHLINGTGAELAGDKKETNAHSQYPKTTSISYEHTRGYHYPICYHCPR